MDDYREADRTVTASSRERVARVQVAGDGRCGMLDLALRIRTAMPSRHIKVVGDWYRLPAAGRDRERARRWRRWTS